MIIVCFLLIFSHFSLVWIQITPKFLIVPFSLVFMLHFWSPLKTPSQLETETTIRLYNVPGVNQEGSIYKNPLSNLYCGVG